jgi:hypothetical protein
MTEETRSFVCGLDLGQSRDFSAFVVLERIAEGPRPPTYESVGGVAWFRFGDPRPATYHLRHLERPAPGTLYPEIVKRVTDLLDTPPLSRETPLAVDKTGVGAPVCDLFRPVSGGMTAITITGGDRVIRDGRAQAKVPKRELVSTLIRLFQTDRLKIAEGLALGRVLVEELLNFRLKVNPETGHDSYAAWRENQHDDLVLATALAAWLGENPESTWGRRG